MKSHLTIVVKLHIIQSKKFIVHTKQSCIYWNECAVRIGLWNGFDTVCLNKNAELVFMRDGIECVWLAGEWKSMLGDKKMRNKANHIVSYRIQTRLVRLWSWLLHCKSRVGHFWYKFSPHAFTAIQLHDFLHFFSSMRFLMLLSLVCTPCSRFTVRYSSMVGLLCQHLIFNWIKL